MVTIKSYRDTWAEVNLRAISENVRAISKLHENVHMMAIVKANGYGHGAVEVAKVALQSGATYLGVALLEEAIELRDAGIKAPILLFGRIRPEYVPIAAAYNVIVTVFQLDWLLEAKKYLKENMRVHVHVKFDTGMGRVGIRTKEEAAPILQFIRDDQSFYLHGIYTHFATADEHDLTYMHKQHNRFVEMLQWLEEWGIPKPLIHSENSVAGMRFSNKAFPLFRLGISMYGITPSPDITDELPVKLKSAFSLKCRLVHVKKVEKGETIGYGRTYTAKKDEWIGTIPIGYADGWLRAHATNGGEVLVNGKRASFAGLICMDQCMIRLPERVEVGTLVTLIGADGEDVITVEEVAERLHTINYEIPCMITDRVPRVYKHS